MYTKYLLNFSILLSLNYLVNFIVTNDTFVNPFKFLFLFSGIFIYEEFVHKSHKLSMIYKQKKIDVLDKYVKEKKYESCLEKIAKKIHSAENKVWQAVSCFFIFNSFLYGTFEIWIIPMIHILNILTSKFITQSESQSDKKKHVENIELCLYHNSHDRMMSADKKTIKYLHETHVVKNHNNFKLLATNFLGTMCYVLLSIYLGGGSPHMALMLRHSFKLFIDTSI